MREKFADLFSPEIADEVMEGGLVSSAGRIMLRKPGYKLGPHTDSAMYADHAASSTSREADEESSGALCLFRPERRPELKHVSTYYPDEEEGIEAEVAKVVPIRENLFVAFVNGQAVAARRAGRRRPADERLPHDVPGAPRARARSAQARVRRTSQDDRLADPAARERWERYVAERRGRPKPPPSGEQLRNSIRGVKGRVRGLLVLALLLVPSAVGRPAERRLPRDHAHAEGECALAVVDHRDDAGRQAARGQVSAAVVDPIGGVHPVEYDCCKTKFITNVKIKGRFADNVISRSRPRATRSPSG